MDSNKKHVVIAGLVGVAGLIVLYLLWKESQGAAPVATGTATTGGGDIQPYPNSQPIKLGDVTIVSGASPQSTYNQVGPIPTVSATDPWGAGGACDGCKDDCDQVGMVVTTQHIAPSTIDAGLENIKTYSQKITSGVEAARQQRVVFSQAA